MHVPPSCEATPRWHQTYKCLAMAGGRGRGAQGGQPPCPPRWVAGARSCPAPRPCTAPPRTGIWLARTICSFRPVAMATGWLEMGFHQRRPGKKIQAGKSLPFFSWTEMKGRGRDPAGGGCVSSFLPMPPHGCPVPWLLLLAPLSLPISSFPSSLSLRCMYAAAAR